MELKLKQEVEMYIQAHEQETYELLKTLARIPAPSGQEEKRMKFCRDWLIACGAKGVYTDSAKNVVYPVGVEDGKPLAVIMAHMDVVFPDQEELPLEEKDGKVYCPGVGDDTANLAALLMCAKYIAQKQLESPTWGVLLVCNSCEEGLGNLKGSRKICEDYKGRIKEFISLDGQLDKVVCRAVGSHRYKVTIKAQGGHSYGCFGNTNAIAQMAGVISDLYQIKVPSYGKTTYNVGTITGGTSVNTIAQEAQMLCEYRSDDIRGLEEMKRKFEEIFESHRKKGEELIVELVGERPCASGVDAEKQEQFADEACQMLTSLTGKETGKESGSTDCNIPLSMGILSICFGTYLGNGAHTREEYIWKESLKSGYRAAFLTVFRYF